MNKIRKGLIGLAILCCAGGMQANAAEVDDVIKALPFSPYASLRAYMGYLQVDQHKYATDSTEPYAEPHDREFTTAICATSRLGVNFALRDLKGNAEIGYNPTGDNAYVRHLYGTWQLGDVSILVGKTWSPYVFFGGEAYNDGGALSYGALYDSRPLQFKVSAFGAYIDIMQPSKQLDANGNEITTGIGSGSKTTTTKYTVNDTLGNPHELSESSTTTVAGSEDVDSPMPKVAAGYDFKNDMFVLGFGGSYNTVKVTIKDNSPNYATLGKLDGTYVHSWLGYAHAKIMVENFYIMGNFGYGQNLKSFGFTSSDNVNYAAALNDENDGIKNTTGMEGFGEVGYKIDFVTLRAGAGYARSKNSTWDKKDDQFNYWINAGFQLDKVLLVPEFSCRDKRENNAGLKENRQYFAGVFVKYDLN